MLTQKRSAGFTLVEIMVVVVIIGLLAALAIPGIQKAREPAMRKSVTNNLRQMYSAAQEYFMETGSTTAGYADIVGDGKWMTALSPVAGEDYSTACPITQAMTSVSVVVPGLGGSTVDYQP